MEHFYLAPLAHPNAALFVAPGLRSLAPHPTLMSHFFEGSPLRSPKFDTLNFLGGCDPKSYCILKRNQSYIIYWSLADSRFDSRPIRGAWCGAAGKRRHPSRGQWPSVPRHSCGGEHSSARNSWRHSRLARDARADSVVPVATRFRMPTAICPGTRKP